jgi:1-acyl-sn-glycerol-3-phosphate acyltransferase
MRAKIHEVIPTKDKTQADKRELKNKVYDIILTELRNPSL